MLRDQGFLGFFLYISETSSTRLLHEGKEVIISIRDTSGQLVRTPNLVRKPAGLYTTREKAPYWDGRNEAVEQAASGIYFYTIQAGSFTATKKMVIAR